MATGAQPPGGGVAPCQKCACCGKDAHSKGETVTESQFYGLDPVTCANGNPVPPDPPIAQDYIKKMLKDCPKLFGQPPCNTYYVASSQEKKEILATWKGAEGAAARTAIGAAPGEGVSHRVPKTAGGCPIGPGNLTKSSDLSPQCQKAEKTLANRQNDRITKLRAAAGVK